MTSKELDELRLRIAKDVAEKRLGAEEGELVAEIMSIAEKFRERLGPEKLAKILIAILVTSCEGAVEIHAEEVFPSGGPMPEAN